VDGSLGASRSRFKFLGLLMENHENGQIVGEPGHAPNRRNLTFSYHRVNMTKIAKSLNGRWSSAYSRATLTQVGLVIVLSQ
jgi:hypothetical protein